MKRLGQSFFRRDTVCVARALLGTQLVREVKGQQLRGMVVETEAYVGNEDSACHASKGKTPRNAVMFGPPGISYVYFVYGMHFMFNVVTEKKGNPCAVLLRGLLPLEGEEEMARRRGRAGRELTNGPAKLCQAMGIDRSLNEMDVVRGDELWFEEYRHVGKDEISCGPRIGIGYADPSDREAQWRFWLENPEAE
ncbi:MAG: DNA-3-methyladenine glycosylase [Deltaproteobacteria bacterium]|nr:DNA-3-methyladenine glycosylase [Deltaproteobacteria bacterium]